MARRRISPLDRALESWAEWVDGSVGLLGASGRSMLAKLIDGRGEILFHNKGGSTGPCDALEMKIEGAVLRLFAECELHADVLRMEYSGGIGELCARRGIAGYSPVGVGQMERAHALGISLRTYKRHLASARQAVGNELGLKP